MASVGQVKNDDIAWELGKFPITVSVAFAIESIDNRSDYIARSFIKSPVPINNAEFRALNFQ